MDRVDEIENAKGDGNNTKNKAAHDFDEIAGASTENVDVVMDESGAGGEIEPNLDDSDVDSDNENDEEEEEDTGEYAEQSKPDARGRVQAVSDSVFDAFSFFGEGARSEDDAECVKSLKAESERWVSKDTINTAVVNTQKQFVCIKFPAVVQNTDKALACLGGVHNIMEARKLGKIDLVFRPDDPYSKPTLGLYKKNNHVLVKCKRRLKVKDINEPSTSASTEEDEMDDGYEYKVEVIGVVSGIFSFDRPCDFQYLPVVKQPGPEGGYKELLNDLVIKFTDDRHEFMNRDVPLFLPPYVFARSERPAKYVFQNDEITDKKHIGLARKMRNMGTYRVSFASKEVPDAPHPDAVAIYEINNGNLDPLKELFKERPLWSRVAIVSRLRAIDQVWLKRHIAMVAYLFNSGPWLHMWCRFGYNPRKHKDSKMYQTIDFRIRKTYLRQKVTAKRPTTYSMKWQGLNTVQGHKLPVMGVMASQNEASGSSVVAAPKEQALDIHYQFSPTQIPPYRQMYYQICDVMVDEIQMLAHQNDGKETECTEKDGWCIPDFLAMSRDILTKQAEYLLATQSIEETRSTKEGDARQEDMT